MEEILSDLIARVQFLENQRTQSQKASTTQGETKTIFSSPVALYSGSITASDADWFNSLSGNHLPQNAKRAIVFAYVTGTSDAVGLNYVEALGQNSRMKILAAGEEGSTSAPGGCCYSEVPLSGGRFDLKATIAGGRTSGSFDYEIELVGYVI